MSDYGTEELLPSPMWQDGEPIAAWPFSYDTSMVREGQARVLRAQGAGTFLLSGALAISGTTSFHASIEVYNHGGRGASYGLAVLDGDGEEIDYESVTIPATVAPEWITYHGDFTISTGASVLPQLRSEPSSNLYVAIVSLRVVNSTTSPHGYVRTDTSVVSPKIDVRGLTDTTSAITMDASGVISAKAIHAASSLTYLGRELSEYFDYPRGVIARSDSTRVRPTTGNLSVETDLCELSFVTPNEQREYQLIFEHAGIGASSRETNFVIRHTTDGTAPTNSSSEILRSLHEPSTYHRTISIGREYAYAANLTVRLRVSIALGGGGSGNIEWRRNTGCSFSVVDGGRYVVRTGGYTSVPPITTSTSASTVSKWQTSYRGDGSQYTYDTSKLYQGQYLSSNGVLKSAIGAPDAMFTDLAGATVNWIKVYLFADHWHSAAGGTAVLGVHASSTSEVTFPGITEAHSVNFGRDQGIWVTLPSSWYASFKSGSYRGITLHANNSTSTTYYGYFTASETRWQWNYTK